WMGLDYEQPGLSPPRTRGARRWLPQRAWLDGAVLVVERGGAVRQCDLAAASEGTLPAARLDRFLVLRAWAGTSQGPPTPLAIPFQRRGSSSCSSARTACGGWPTPSGRTRARRRAWRANCGAWPIPKNGVTRPVTGPCVLARRAGDGRRARTSPT